MKRKPADEKQRTISSFFTAAPKHTTKPQQQVQSALQSYAAEAPLAKRQKPDGGSPSINIELEPRVTASVLPSGHEGRWSVNAAGTYTGNPGRELAASIPATRNFERHSKAQSKLVGASGATSLAEPGLSVPCPVDIARTVSAATAAGHRREQQQPKYTPLEQQVVALKAANPGVLLIVEVGYKMRFFGEDAQIAAQELGIYAYPDHNFLTASIPVQRLPVHVRRLVAAGHKVGVVRQVESAALKAVGDNRSAPFTRSLTGLYTAATLDAAEKADKVGDASAIEASQELELLLGPTTSTATGANYMLIIAEQQQAESIEGARAAAASDHGTTAMQSPNIQGSSRSGTGLLGVLAIDVGSGDIAYGVCTSNVGTSPCGSSSGSNSDGVAIPLEAALLSVSPAEIVVCTATSHATHRQLVGFMTGHGGRRCRLERLQQRGQQQQQHRLGGSSKTLAATGSAGCSYLDTTTLSVLQEFYGGSCSSSSCGSPLPAGTAAAAGDCSAQQPSTRDDLQFIMTLPPLVLQVLAGAIQHLAAYNLTGVLKCTSGFRTLGGVGTNMLLDGNALRQLEVLAAGGDGPQRRQGSLLHLIDRSATAAGGRLLRRWLSAPCADRAMILDRQDAVAALLAASGGDSSTGSTAAAAALGGNSEVLQRIPAWLGKTKQDLERSLSRVAAGTASPAETVGLWSALAQLPQALRLPLHPGTQELDLDALATVVPSRLLVSLLTAAASPAAIAAARQVLGWLDAKAALKNDYLGLFKSEERFPEVFACAAAVDTAESQLHGLLPQLATAAGVPSLSYVSIQNQGNWMVELPAGRTSVPQGWVKVCGTKKVCRYHSPEVKDGMAALARAQEQQAATAHTAWQSLLADFSALHHAACREAVAAVAQLDALHSLAILAAAPGYTRPEFLDDAEPQQLLIHDGKHPMLDLALDGAAVGNTLELTWDGIRAAIITGPNMGGKSVLIRQAALTIILAQLGSWVPASRCRLSVFDGVFSRMGATDCLIAGRSTFAEELGDASHILATATNRSLVIMDELGRGTATHDGVAIATATLKHLVGTKQCLTLFVTHYPEVAALASSSSSSSSGSSDDPARNHIAVYHMAYVRHDSTSAAAEAAGANGTSVAAAAAGAIPTITFLYRLTAGAADASFGLNVAQMAGLPQSVVQRAAILAAQFHGRLETTGNATQQQQQQKDVLQTFQQVVKQLQSVATLQGAHGQQGVQQPEKQQQQQDVQQPEEQQQQQNVQQPEEQQQQQPELSLLEAYQQLVGVQTFVRQLLQPA